MVFLIAVKLLLLCVVSVARILVILSEVIL